MDKVFTFRLQELPGYVLILAAVAAGVLIAARSHKPGDRLSRRQKKARIAWIAVLGLVLGGGAAVFFLHR